MYVCTMQTLVVSLLWKMSSHKAQATFDFVWVFCMIDSSYGKFLIAGAANISRDFSAMQVPQMLQ